MKQLPLIAVFNEFYDRVRISRVWHRQVGEELMSIARNRVNRRSEPKPEINKLIAPFLRLNAPAGRFFMAVQHHVAISRSEHFRIDRCRNE
jgi:hypothetical protein